MSSHTPASPEEFTLTLGAHRHSALAAGPRDGTLVLLLHGWPEFADSWTPVMSVLADAGYRAVAVDQRGYAPQARPTEVADYTIDQLVADALGFADALGAGEGAAAGAGRFHLVTHDWGGMVGWALAGAHSARLRSLSVLATPHPTALWSEAETDAEQAGRLDYVRLIQQPGQVAEASMLADGAARLRAAYAGRVPAHLVERNVRRLSEPGALTATLNWYRAVGDGFAVPAGRVAAPTLYVWGSKDGALGRRAAERTAEYVDGPYRFEVLEGASHWLPEEAPDVIAPLLLEHLAAHPD